MNNYEHPFLVNKQQLSVHNGKVVKIYLTDPNISDEKQQQIDGAVQYLMDESFVNSEKCKVEIYIIK